MGNYVIPPANAIRPRGVWSAASVLYALNDLVDDGGDLFVCILQNTSAAGNEPGTGGGASYWLKYAEGLTTDQVAAIAGTSGTTPSGTNKFVDNADTRNTNERQPVRYADVTAAEAAATVDGLVCYVKSLDNWFRGLAAGGAYTVDHLTILATGDAGNTRWIGIGPHYIYGTVTLSDGTAVALTRAMVTTLANQSGTNTGDFTKLPVYQGNFNQ